MSKEIELKFEVPARSLAKLKESRLIGGNAGQPPQPRRLVSVYFDTDKFDLKKKGISLRVRHIGRKRVQTIKTEDGRSAGLFNRQEWEQEIKGNSPDLDAARGTALEPLLTQKIRRALKPLFETRVQRTVVPVSAGDSRIELVLDRGRIRADAKSSAISEVELELKSGDRSALFGVVDDLTKLAPVSLAVRSKADRGYALIEGSGTQALNGTPIVLDPGITVAEAFRLIALSCLRHLAANETAVCEKESEGVHQMRVGLRRLRAAVSIFSDMLRSDETERVKSELKWLAGQLGPARDLDVFVTEGIAPLQKSRPDKRALQALQTDLEGRRLQAFEIARQEVQSPRYRELVMMAVRWIEDGDWAKNTDELIVAMRERPADSFSREVLTRRAKKVAKKAAILKDLDPVKRHKLRIAIKKLRYTSEFFASLFSHGKAGKRAVAFQSALKNLQDCLGALNDIAVHEDMADKLIHTKPRRRAKVNRREHAFAVGVVSGRQQARAEPILKKAIKAAAAFGDVRPFWK